MSGKYAVLTKSVYDDNLLKGDVKCFEEGCLLLIYVKVSHGLAAAMMLLHVVRMLSIQ